MLVTFMRHGVAVDREDPRCPPDPERPLTVEGRNRTEAALRGLKALGLKPERVLASPWLRCQQTARLAIEGLGLPRRALVPSELLAPGADPRAIWDELAPLDLASVLLVGHGGTLEPIAGVALGLPTHLPGAPRPPVDLAYRTLALRKAGALQLEVRFAPPAPPVPEPLAPAPPAVELLAPEPLTAEPPVPPAVGPLPVIADARLAWKLPARLLRQIGR
jgi:phosphohistidine phosphatase SixA